jgi:hypothetical protein
MREFADWVENKQLVVRGWRTEETIQIDDDLSRKRCGAGGMKDVVNDLRSEQIWPSIVEHGPQS